MPGTVRAWCAVVCAGIFSACSPPMPDRLSVHEVDFRTGETVSLELPNDMAVIFAPEELRSVVACRAVGPGDAPDRHLERYRAQDVYGVPSTRHGRKWFQVGAIHEGPGTARVTCTGPDATPLFAQIWIYSA